MTLTERQKITLRAIVKAAIAQGAVCQRLNSFVAAEPGNVLRSVYDVMTEQAIMAMETIESDPIHAMVDHLQVFIQQSAQGGSPAERAKQRPANYAALSSQDQWAIDRRLGILDWDGH
jgi:hypothetical protein